MKYLILLAVILVLIGCSGEEIISGDTIPPRKPDLIHHLGDTGDNGTSVYPGANYYNLNTEPDLENNGIDAEDEGDFIQIQWLNLQDTDIDYLEIYRFSLADFQADTLDFVTKIDSIDYTNQTLYVDQTASVFKNYFYFISAVDEAGNFTYSDTVCYKIMDKPIPFTPVNGTTVTNTDNLEFSWFLDYNFTKYRLLLFDQDRNIIWQYEPLDLEDPLVVYNGPAISSGTTVTWRLDGFGPTLSNVEIFDKSYDVLSGAESEERILYVQ